MQCVFSSFLASFKIQVRSEKQASMTFSNFLDTLPESNKMTTLMTVESYLNDICTIYMYIANSDCQEQCDLGLQCLIGNLRSVVFSTIV